MIGPDAGGRPLVAIVVSCAVAAVALGFVFLALRRGARAEAAARVDRCEDCPRPHDGWPGTDGGHLCWRCWFEQLIGPLEPWQLSLIEGYLQAGADALEVLATLEEAEVACRVCGCTDDRACAFGCWWVPDPEGLGPLCSTCLPVAALPQPAGPVMDLLHPEQRGIAEGLSRERGVR